MSKIFLTAEWKRLLLVNYLIDPERIMPYLPFKTELDLWQEKCYISLVGFRFLNTRVRGIKIPFHINFDEVNLRFYVKYNNNGIWKRGVVFIKEIVPKPLLALVANTLYAENYESQPMNSEWKTEGACYQTKYSWKKQKKWNSISISTGKVAGELADKSEESFLLEHYWGYTKVSHHKTSEYEVLHPKWKVYETIQYSVDTDFGGVYGQDFEFLNRIKPQSAFLAEGSEISVKMGNLL